MNHLAAEWEKSRGVGGREDGRPDLADDSVNGVIATIPPSLHYKQEVTNKPALTPALPFSSSRLHLSPFARLSVSHARLFCIYLGQNETGPGVCEKKWLGLYASVCV